MEVALLTVGDELLSGDTENTNASWLGRQLADAGATVTRVLTVPDDESGIADAVARYHEAFDAVIVTGGIGGTPDDVTKAGVADAFDGDRTTETIYTPAPEGALVGAVTAARERFDVAVGSYPRRDDAPGRVKVTGDDPDAVADAAAWLRDRTETV